MLHRQVQMINQFGQTRVRIDQTLRKLVGVAGGVANAFNAGDVGYIIQQSGEISNLISIAHLAAVGVDVLAQQINFFDALIGQACHLHQHVFKRA